MNIPDLFFKFFGKGNQFFTNKNGPLSKVSGPLSKVSKYIYSRLSQRCTINIVTSSYIIAIVQVNFYSLLVDFITDHKIFSINVSAAVYLVKFVGVIRSNTYL